MPTWRKFLVLAEGSYSKGFACLGLSTVAQGDLIFFEKLAGAFWIAVRWWRGEEGGANHNNHYSRNVFVEFFIFYSFFFPASPILSSVRSWRRGDALGIGNHRSTIRAENIKISAVMVIYSSQVDVGMMSTFVAYRNLEAERAWGRNFVFFRLEHLKAVWVGVFLFQRNKQVGFRLYLHYFLLPPLHDPDVIGVGAWRGWPADDVAV